MASVFKVMSSLDLMSHSVALKTSIAQKFSTTLRPELLAGIRVVLDMAQGATYLVASRIFTTLGATVIARNNQPTGYNINAHVAQRTRARISSIPW